MTLKLIAVESCELKATKQSGPPDMAATATTTIDLVKVTTTFSTKCKAETQKIATDKITMVWPVSGCPFPSSTFTFVSGAGEITATASKTKAQNKLVIREGDTGSCAGSWTNNSTGATLQCECNYEVLAAGQAKVRAQ